MRADCESGEGHDRHYHDSADDPGKGTRQEPAGGAYPAAGREEVGSRGQLLRCPRADDLVTHTEGVTESPDPTEEELEQGPSCIEDEEEMRGPHPADPELPDERGDDE